MSHIDLDNDNKTTKSGFYVTYRLDDEGENDMQVIHVYVYMNKKNINKPCRFIPPVPSFDTYFHIYLCAFPRSMQIK